MSSSYSSLDSSSSSSRVEFLQKAKPAITMKPPESLDSSSSGSLDSEDSTSSGSINRGSEEEAEKATKIQSAWRQKQAKKRVSELKDARQAEREAANQAELENMSAQVIQRRAKEKYGKESDAPRPESNNGGQTSSEEEAEKATKIQSAWRQKQAKKRVSELKDARQAEREAANQAELENMSAQVIQRRAKEKYGKEIEATKQVSSVIATSDTNETAANVLSLQCLLRQREALNDVLKRRQLATRSKAEQSEQSNQREDDRLAKEPTPWDGEAELFQTVCGTSSSEFLSHYSDLFHSAASFLRRDHVRYRSNQRDLSSDHDRKAAYMADLHSTLRETAELYKKGCVIFQDELRRTSTTRSILEVGRIHDSFQFSVGRRWLLEADIARCASSELLSQHNQDRNTLTLQIEQRDQELLDLAHGVVSAVGKVALRVNESGFGASFSSKYANRHEVQRAKVLRAAVEKKKRSTYRSGQDVPINESVLLQGSSSEATESLLRFIEEINYQKDTIRSLSEIGSPSDEDLATLEKAKETLGSMKLAQVEQLKSSLQNNERAAVDSETVEEVWDFLEELVKETDIPTGNSELLKHLIPVVSTDYAAMVEERGLASIAASDGSRSYLVSLLSAICHGKSSIAEVHLDFVEVLSCCAFNQLNRVPLMLQALKLRFPGSQERLIDFHHASFTDQGFETVWQEFFEDIASKKRAAPREDRTGRLELLQEMISISEVYPTIVPLNVVSKIGGDQASVLQRAALEDDVEVFEFLMGHESLFLKSIPPTEESPSVIDGLHFDPINGLNPENDMNLLMCAVFGNSVGIVRYLVENDGRFSFGSSRLDVHVCSVKLGATALELASQLGRDPEIIAILKAKVSMSTKQESLVPVSSGSIVLPSKSRYEAADEEGRGNLVASQMHVLDEAGSAVIVGGFFLRVFSTQKDAALMATQHFQSIVAYARVGGNGSPLYCPWTTTFSFGSVLVFVQALMPILRPQKLSQEGSGMGHSVLMQAGIRSYLSSRDLLQFEGRPRSDFQSAAVEENQDDGSAHSNNNIFIQKHLILTQIDREEFERTQSNYKQLLYQRGKRAHPLEGLPHPPEAIALDNNQSLVTAISSSGHPLLLYLNASTVFLDRLSADENQRQREDTVRQNDKPVPTIDSTSLVFNTAPEKESSLQYSIRAWARKLDSTPGLLADRATFRHDAKQANVAMGHLGSVFAESDSDSCRAFLLQEMLARTLLDLLKALVCSPTLRSKGKKSPLAVSEDSDEREKSVVSFRAKFCFVLLRRVILGKTFVQSTSSATEMPPMLMSDLQAEDRSVLQLSIIDVASPLVFQRYLQSTGDFETSEELSQSPLWEFVDFGAALKTVFTKAFFQPVGKRARTSNPLPFSCKFDLQLLGRKEAPSLRFGIPNHFKSLEDSILIEASNTKDLKLNCSTGARQAYQATQFIQSWLLSCGVAAELESQVDTLNSSEDTWTLLHILSKQIYYPKSSGIKFSPQAFQDGGSCPASMDTSEMGIAILDRNRPAFAPELLDFSRTYLAVVVSAMKLFVHERVDVDAGLLLYDLVVPKLLLIQEAVEVLPPSRSQDLPLRLADVISTIRGHRQLSTQLSAVQQRENYNMSLVTTGRLTEGVEKQADLVRWVGQALALDDAPQTPDIVLERDCVVANYFVFLSLHMTKMHQDFFAKESVDTIEAIRTALVLVQRSGRAFRIRRAAGKDRYLWALRRRCRVRARAMLAHSALHLLWIQRIGYSYLHRRRARHLWISATLQRIGRGYRCGRMETYKLLCIRSLHRVMAGTAVRARMFQLMRRKLWDSRAFRLQRFASGYLTRKTCCRDLILMRRQINLRRVMATIGPGYLLRRQLGRSLTRISSVAKGFFCRAKLFFKWSAIMRRNQRLELEKLLAGDGWPTYHALLQQNKELLKEIDELNFLLDRELQERKIAELTNGNLFGGAPGRAFNRVNRNPLLYTNISRMKGRSGSPHTDHSPNRSVERGDRMAKSHDGVLNAQVTDDREDRVERSPSTLHLATVLNTPRRQGEAVAGSRKMLEKHLRTGPSSEVGLAIGASSPIGGLTTLQPALLLKTPERQKEVSLNAAKLVHSPSIATPDQSLSFLEMSPPSQKDFPNPTPFGTDAEEEKLLTTGEKIEVYERFIIRMKEKNKTLRLRLKDWASRGDQVLEYGASIREHLGQLVQQQAFLVKENQELEMEAGELTVKLKTYDEQQKAEEEEKSTIERDLRSSKISKKSHFSKSEALDLTTKVLQRRLKILKAKVDLQNKEKLEPGDSAALYKTKILKAGTRIEQLKYELSLARMEAKKRDHLHRCISTVEEKIDGRSTRVKSSSPERQHQDKQLSSKAQSAKKPLKKASALSPLPKRAASTTPSAQPGSFNMISAADRNAQLTAKQGERETQTGLRRSTFMRKLAPIEKKK